jgi:hypothetical protein
MKIKEAFYQKEFVAGNSTESWRLVTSRRGERTFPDKNELAGEGRTAVS